ncbi:hypothetical protein NUACC21_75230 [Scytonema sp. NUACC21]
MLVNNYIKLTITSKIKPKYIILNLSSLIERMTYFEEYKMPLNLIKNDKQ